MMPNRYVLALCACLPLAAAAAGGPSIADFSANPTLEDVRLSPNGDYIAGKAYFKNGPGLAIIRLADKKMTASLAFGHEQNFSNIEWVAPNRVVISPEVYFGISDVPGWTGELFGINVDGGNQTYLFGYRGNQSTGTHIQHAESSRAWASIIKTLSNDPDHAVIAVDDMGTSQDTAYTRTYKLNVNSGMLTDELIAPAAGYTGFLADDNGFVRYAVCKGLGFKYDTYVRSPEHPDWQQVDTGNLKATNILPIAISADNAKVYLGSNENAGQYCLIEQTLATNARRTLSCKSNDDIYSVTFSFDRKEPIAVSYVVSGLTLLDTGNPDRALLQRLTQSFPHSLIDVTSRNSDGSKVVIMVRDGRNPGDYYLLDTKTAKAQLIASRYDSIYPDEMSERRTISFKSRDGQPIEGILTIPRGHEPKSLPLVVHPHGGPLGVWDGSEWDREPELLASRGYAVLQVNYRGSGGYGDAFREAGRQKWDSTIIDDITDGARWAIAQGYADPQRLCIYGGSYGAYAALESAEREPDLYRCAAGLSGVYDLNLLRHDSDITDTQAGRDDFANLIGDSAERLREASPVTHLERLKAAVFIAHGGEDQRAPISQAKALMKALDERHYPYEKLIISGEGHGFYDPKDREQFYTQLLAFLDHSIGPQAAGAAPTAAPVVGTAASASGTAP